MDDYLNSMVSKFRTKAKSVFKRSSDIEVKDLNTSAIEKCADEIHHLYENVVEHADFKFGELSDNHL